MKIRNGFVSNSSSSSFMVSLPNSKKGSGKCTISLEIDLEDFEDATFKSLKDLRDYFLDDEGWPEEDLLGAYWYEEAKKELESGRIILHGTVGNVGGRPGEQVLYENGLEETLKSKEIKIIDDVSIW